MAWLPQRPMYLSARALGCKGLRTPGRPPVRPKARGTRAAHVPGHFPAAPAARTARRACVTASWSTNAAPAADGLFRQALDARDGREKRSGYPNSIGERLGSVDASDGWRRTTCGNGKAIGDRTPAPTTSSPCPWRHHPPVGARKATPGLAPPPATEHPPNPGTAEGRVKRIGLRLDHHQQQPTGALAAKAEAGSPAIRLLTWLVTSPPPREICWEARSGGAGLLGARPGTPVGCFEGRPVWGEGGQALRPQRGRTDAAGARPRSPVLSGHWPGEAVEQATWPPAWPSSWHPIPARPLGRTCWSPRQRRRPDHAPGCCLAPAVLARGAGRAPAYQKGDAGALHTRWPLKVA
eukprot:scaffold1132_cov377-Prasinococcus_capsulatus_cf.AAC.8